MEHRAATVYAGRQQRDRAMNVDLRTRQLPAAANTSRLAIADCDIHHSPRDGMKGLYPYLEARWREHLEVFGSLPRQAFQNGPAYPKSQPDASRRDAWPPEGGRPGSSLDFMRSHHLDAHNITLGVLAMIRPHPGSFMNGYLAEAVSRAMNLWQVAEWTAPEPRLKASLLVPYEDGEASAREIHHWAGHKDYVQVLMLSRTAEPAGQKCYWPIYQAAADVGWPIGVHAFGFGGYPVSGGGWPSFYMEDMVGHAQSSQSMLTSLVIEGVFERFPTLKIVLIEAGFGWLPSLCWRLDKLFLRMRAELPHLRRLPSEYIREHVWLTTQPMEEPAVRAHAMDTIDWIGWDRLLFATDYPHWDYDDPSQVLPNTVTEAQRRAFFMDNARGVYSL
jgi:predicted TIM-barrel fold metal-dependent hydrolase